MEFLKKGDKIVLLSTARSIDLTGIAPMKHFFEEKGFTVVVADSIGKVFHQFAGEDSFRAEQFQKYLDDPSIKAILFARGGYGSIRVIDKINWMYFKSNPKWLCGFSDITIFHNHIQKNFGIPTVHSLMASTYNSADENSLESIESLYKILIGNNFYVDGNSEDRGRSGEAEGILVGGNLSIIYSLQGSVSDMNCDGKILFLEDLDEYLYQVDRMMVALKRTGKFEKLKGLIVGGFTEMKDHEIPFGMNAEAIIMDAVKEYEFPVIFNFPCGHISKNLALPLGTNIKMEVDEKYFWKVSSMR